MNRAELLDACVRGISFCTQMVQELPPRGIKGRTMRILKPEPVVSLSTCYGCEASNVPLWYDDEKGAIRCEECGLGLLRAKPRHKAGDILYVRETFARQFDGLGPLIEYRADWESRDRKASGKINEYGFEVPRWHPSIHMPRAAARTFIRITGVKAQRPQELYPQEILAEGITCDLLETCGAHDCEDCKVLGLVGCICHDKWARLWDSLRSKEDLPKYGYEANPLCWCYEFEVVPYES